MHTLQSILTISLYTLHQTIPPITAFQPSITPHHPYPPQTTTKLHSSSSSPSPPSNIKIVPIAEDDTKSLLAASQFMLESFWIPLSSPPSPLPPSTTTALTSTILQEFTDRYGEIMGKRQLSSRLLSARDPSSNTILGLVSADVGIVNTSRQYQYTRTEAEDLVRTAVGGLPPSKRREWGKKSVREIVTELLPEEMVAVAILSNLAVDGERRRAGIGGALCRAVEGLVEEEGFGGGGLDLYLRVEGGNGAARGLYERMGFGVAWVEEETVVLRVDLEGGGGFVEEVREVVSYVKKVEG